MPAVSDHLKSVSDDTKRMLKVRFEEVLVPNMIKNKYLTGSFYRVFVQFKVLSISLSHWSKLKSTSDKKGIRKFTFETERINIK